MICNILLSLILLHPIIYCMTNKSNLQQTNKLYISNYWPRNDYYPHNSRIQHCNLNEKILQNCTVYHYTWAFISAWCPSNNLCVWDWNQYFTVCFQTLHHFANPFMQSEWICSVLFAWFSLQPQSREPRLWSELTGFYAFSFVFFCTHQKQHCIRRIRWTFF